MTYINYTIKQSLLVMGEEILRALFGNNYLI